MFINNYLFGGYTFFTLMGLFWLILLIGAINVMRISREKKSLLKKRVLEWSLAIFFSALVLWGGFDGEGHFQFIEFVE